MGDLLTRRSESTHPVTFTRPAVPTAFRSDAGVLRRIWVSVRTVCLGALPCRRGGSEVAAADVLGVGDGFEVLGADASAVTAGVVEFEVPGDRADEQLVDDAVRRRAPSVVADVPVTLRVVCRHPRPTTGGSCPDFRPNPRRQIIRTVHAMNPNSIGGQ